MMISHFVKVGVKRFDTVEFQIPGKGQNFFLIHFYSPPPMGRCLMR